MEKKTVNLKEIVRDINSGMHETQLMMRHELSPAQLRKVMEKLEAMGQIKPGVRSVQKSVAYVDDSSRITCPNCRSLVPQDLNDCPKCGVVLSRYRQSALPTESAEHRIRVAASRAVALSPAPAPRSDYAGKIITVAVIAALILIPYGIYRGFRSGMESAQTESFAGLVQGVLHEVDEGDPDYFKLAKRMANSTGDAVITATKKDSGSPSMTKLAEIYSELMALGGLKGQLDLRMKASQRHFVSETKTAASRTSRREAAIKQLQADLFKTEEALANAQDIAAQAEASARLHVEQMAAQRGEKVVAHRTLRTTVDGVTVEQLQKKRQDITDKIASAESALFEDQQSERSEIKPVVENEDDTQISIDDLTEKLASGQQQLVTLCHDFLKMAGKTPAPGSSE